MIAALLIPAFDLQATLRGAPVPVGRPAALAPAPARAPVIGTVNAAAQTKGLRPGMRIGEALATGKHSVNQAQVGKGNLSINETFGKVTFNVETQCDQFSAWNAKQFMQGE